MILITIQNIQIAERNMLPALKQVLYADQTQEALEYISQTHNISEFELAATVGYVLLGLMPVVELANNLQESCNISQEQAYAVVVDIRKYIFAPIAGDLATIQEIAKKNYNTYNKSL